MQRQIILVMRFRRIKLLQRHDLRNDRHTGCQLPDIGSSDLLLLGAGVKNCGAVLTADIGALTVELGRVMRDADEHMQQLPVGYLRRIECDAHGFRVPRVAQAHDVVMRRCSAATRIARDDFGYPFDMLEYRIHTPKAASAKSNNFCHFSILSHCFTRVNSLFSTKTPTGNHWLFTVKFTYQTTKF
jgi:hypothetical protein